MSNFRVLSREKIADNLPLPKFPDSENERLSQFLARYRRLKDELNEAKAAYVRYVKVRDELEDEVFNYQSKVSWCNGKAAELKEKYPEFFGGAAKPPQVHVQTGKLSDLTYSL